jgi:micrococcal nuclease
MIKLIHLLLLLSIFLSTVSCTSKSARIHQKKLHDSSESKHSGITKKYFYQVTKVVDGDTFWVDNHTTEGLKIRLIGIDAPESRNVFKKKKQPYGIESKAFLTQMLQNEYVRLEFDVDSLDQYGRTLAYAYLENGEMINEVLVKTGNAQIMTITPNIVYENLFIEAQRTAREKSLGLWSIEMTE